MEKTHKLFQSMVNLNLSPEEFERLTILGQIREQSLRALVSSILRQELNAFADIIEHRNQLNRLQSLGTVSTKRTRGRPRVKETREVLKGVNKAALPASMLDIIEQDHKED